MKLQIKERTRLYKCVRKQGKKTTWMMISYVENRKCKWWVKEKLRKDSLIDYQYLPQSVNMMSQSKNKNKKELWKKST